MATKTTISILKKSIGRLNKLKIHPREPYWEVIERLIKKIPKKLWKT